jgi:hypothetical protein
MARSPKTVSIRHLHAAVKAALEAAKKKHPEFKIDPATPAGGLTTLPLYYRYPWICGLPVPWPEYDLQNLATFTNTFVANLASNQQISALAVDGKFEPTLHVSPGDTAIGFTPGPVSFTE